MSDQREKRDYALYTASAAVQLFKGGSKNYDPKRGDPKMFEVQRSNFSNPPHQSIYEQSPLVLWRSTAQLRKLVG